MKGVLAATALALASGVAYAQPGQPSGGALPPGSSPPTAPVAPTDDRGQYEAGYQAMLNGDFATASAAFTTAAAMTQDPELRRAASEMARLAGDLAMRKAVLTYAPPPGVGRDVVVAPPPPATATNEEDQPTGGRATFVTTTTMAAFYTGIVIDDLIDVGDVRTGTLVVMGTTAAGVLGSIYGTEGHRMTGAMADAWGLGMLVGTGNALLLSGPIGLYDTTSNTSEKVQSFVLASAWGGATAGLLVADAVNPTRAQVNVTGTIGMMSVASTLLTLAVIQPSDVSGNAFLSITAAGLDVGLGAGAAFASKLDWSMSRARYVGLGAFLGALAGGGTSLLLIGDNGNDNSGRLAAGVTLAGLWAGFGLAAHLTRDMAPDLRFQKQTGPQLTFAPAAIKGGAGIGLVGSF